MLKPIEPPLENTCIDCGISELYVCLIMDGSGWICRKCYSRQEEEEFLRDDEDDYHDFLTDEEAGR